MAAETTRNLEALAAQAQTLMSVFTKAGYEAVAPSIIQPADVFLDVIGESLRARTYVFTDQDGAELCLRPDITVPTCRLHLERHADPVTPARYCYNGPAFRFQPQGATLRIRANFARPASSVSATSRAKQPKRKPRHRRQGNRKSRPQGLDAEARRPRIVLERSRRGRRLSELEKAARRCVPEAALVSQCLERLRVGARVASPGVPEELLSAMRRDEWEKSEAAVAVYLEENAIELLGTRSLADITEHLMVIAEDRKEKPLDASAIELIERYVGVTGPATTAGEKIAALLKGAANGAGAALKRTTGVWPSLPMRVSISIA